MTPRRIGRSGSRAPNIRKVTTAATLASVLAIGVTGCTDGDDPGAERPSTTGSASASAPVDPGDIAPADLPEPPRVDRPAGAVKDVTFGACDTTAGRQDVTGRVHNPTARGADYVITISWITSASDVRGRGFTVVRDLAPGASTEWSIDARVASGATACTHNVQRGQVK
ncbi:hypothetical protein [Nocardioides sp. LHG3406-4]|uniref:hypothetical protein n=1 Tax=Nocardioides sp. LHG3406-4 TaxID=2804575 RepID=UPI003CEF2860